MQNTVFKLAGLINILIAIGHIVCLFWAHRVFELTGVGEEMSKLADINPIIPYVITVIVAIIFLIFGLYAFSAAGIIRPLPLLKLGVLLITAVFLFRGIGGLVLKHESVLEISYSLVAVFIGALLFIGAQMKWKRTTK